MKSVSLKLAACLLVVSCSKEVDVPPEPPRPVIIQTVAEAQGKELRTFTGVIEASGLATLGFEVSGRITQMFAVEGRAYKKGDVLAQLDVANYKADLRRAEAEALNANEELKRAQQLFESSNASRSQFDSAIAAQRAATASLDVARKKVADGTLIMPYDGVIDEILLDEQSVVGQGAQVLTIQGDGAMRMDIGVPAETISQVKVGMLALVDVKTIAVEGLQAKVRKVSPQSTQNGIYPVNLDLVDAPDAIRGGMDAEARMEFANPRGNSVHVETSAIVSSIEGQPYVWVLTSTSGKEGTVSKREVTIGELRRGGEMEILKGLSAGEQVVTRGVHRLTDGQTVKLPVQGS